MAKLILFSEPGPSLLNQLAPEIFIAQGITVAYMPSDGTNIAAKYENYWREYTGSHGAKMVTVNNSLRGEDVESEKQKVETADVLIITGGNTFLLLKHLRESGLDVVVKKFIESGKTYVGFSAGAIILSPTIEATNLPPGDENLVGLKDLTGLDVINFDIYPHYVEEEHEQYAQEYEAQTGRVIKRIGDEDFSIIEV